MSNRESVYCTPMVDGDGSVWMQQVSEETARALRQNGYEVVGEDE